VPLHTSNSTDEYEKETGCRINNKNPIAAMIEAVLIFFNELRSIVSSYNYLSVPYVRDH
jgi:hypothetical protein